MFLLVVPGGAGRRVSVRRLFAAEGAAAEIELLAR